MSDLRTAAQQALEALKLSVPTTRAGEDEYAEKGWQEHRAAMVALKAALAEPEERNFCPRCGKRTHDIHTCTPPQLWEGA